MNDDRQARQSAANHAQSTGTTLSGALTGLFAIQLTMSTADWMLIVYFQIQVFHVTGSALSIMCLVLCELVPMLSIGPLAGKVADKHEARQILTVSSAAKILLACTFLVGSLRLSPSFLYLAAAVSAVLGRFFTPAAAAFLPRMTQPLLLPKANAIMMAMRTTGMAAGTVLAGTTTTIGTSLTPSIIMTLIALSLVAIRRLPHGMLPAGHQEAARHIDAARPFLKEHLHKLRLPLVSSIQVMLALGAFEVLALVYVTRVLHEPAHAVGFLFGAYGAGMLLGLLLAATRSTQSHAVNSLWACMFILPAAIGSLHMVDDMMLAIVSVALAGVCEAIVMTVALLRLYQLTPSMRHGHMIAILDTLSGSAFLIGVLVVGAIADKVMIGLLLQTLAFTLLAFPVALLLSSCLWRSSPRQGHFEKETRSQENPPS